MTELRNLKEAIKKIKSFKITSDFDVYSEVDNLQNDGELVIDTMTSWEIKESIEIFLQEKYNVYIEDSLYEEIEEQHQEIIEDFEDKFIQSTFASIKKLLPDGKILNKYWDDSLSTYKYYLEDDIDKYEQGKTIIEYNNYSSSCMTPSDMKYEYGKFILFNDEVVNIHNSYTPQKGHNCLTRQDKLNIYLLEDIDENWNIEVIDEKLYKKYL